MVFEEEVKVKAYEKCKKCLCWDCVVVCGCLEEYCAECDPKDEDDVFTYCDEKKVKSSV